MSGLRFLSVCSGLEGASLALDPLGWSPVGFAEIEAFPSAIIAERFGSNLPGEPLSRNAPPNFGDFTAIDLAQIGAVDLLIGGTPCQAFSIAGKRLSLADARGNLSLAYVVLAHELARSHELRNAIWENVPGVLNTADNAFGCFLGALVGHDSAFPRPHGAGWPGAGMVDGPRGRAAWRLLDAQYFGVAQRRQRVFVVADFGNGADPAAVLFESASLRGNSPPSREKGERIAGSLEASLGRRGGKPNDHDPAGGLVAAFGGGNRSGPVEQAATLTAKGQKCDFEVETFIAHTLRGEGFDASEGGTGRCVAFAQNTRDEVRFQGDGDICGALAAEPGMKQTTYIAQAFDLRGREGGAQFEGPHDTANIRAASGGSSRSYVATTKGAAVGRAPEGGEARRWAVRRLTPTECERLQGVPDGWTRIPWRGKAADVCTDGNRYKALGNSWAVPVVAWIGRRITENLGKRQ